MSGSFFANGGSRGADRNVGGLHYGTSASRRQLQVTGVIARRSAYKTGAAVSPFKASVRTHQIRTRPSGARYSESRDCTTNAAYHGSRFRTVSARHGPG